MRHYASDTVIRDAQEVCDAHPKEPSVEITSGALGWRCGVRRHKRQVRTVLRLWEDENEHPKKSLLASLFDQTTTMNTASPGVHVCVFVKRRRKEHNLHHNNSSFRYSKALKLCSPLIWIMMVLLIY